MKRLLSFLLALALLLALTGCSISETISTTIGQPADTSTATGETEQENATEPTPYIEFVTFPTEPTEPQETDPIDPRPRPTDPVQNTEPAWPDDDRPRPTEPETQPTEPESQLDRYGTYTRRDDVALYIHLYGRLPYNFITKSQAKALGWKSGSLEKYAPGKCIGGDRFYNKEGLLPNAPGRIYYECDIDTLGASSRGAKRIVYSNDGLIYYTSNHYASFILLYGAP